MSTVMPKKASLKVKKIARKNTVSKVEPIPKGYHTITPSIIVHDGAAAIEFYKKGFDAKEKGRSLGPGGKIWHAELQIGDSRVFLMDEFPEMGANSARRIGDSPGSIWLYVKDVDKLYHRAVGAGASSVMEPRIEFWGDRRAGIEDPFGHTWYIASRKENVSSREMEKRRLAAVRETEHRPS